MITRKIISRLQQMLRKYPILTLTGPRQSGKTTLLTKSLPDYQYYNLERPDVREMFIADPVSFLRDPGKGIILDEIQRIPGLFSYIQAFADQNQKNGQYILSGSQSFLLNQSISQSLAGRTSINHLMPFEFSEIKGFIENKDTETIIYNGFYPRLYDQGISPVDFYPPYIQTYVERDIRTLQQIADLDLFHRFLALCAGRIGQVLNLTSLANDCGITVNTAKSWLSLLETSFVLFFLKPWHKNFNKRLIKSPKLYFYDTGLAISLLNIKTSENLKTHYLYGSLFENMVIAEILKSEFHQGKTPNLYYWRESNGTEIDLIFEVNSTKSIALEIKSGATYNRDYLKNLLRFPGKDQNMSIDKHLVYDGESDGKTKDIHFYSWRKLHDNLPLGNTP